MALKQPQNKLEWVARVVLTLQVYLTFSGYIQILQTNYQLTSPLVPKSTVYEVTSYLWWPSAMMGIALIAALWFYFFRKHAVTVVVGAASIIAFEIWVRYFPQ